MIFFNSVYFERWIIFHCHNVIHYEKCFDMFDFNIHKRIMLKLKCSSNSSECQSWKMSLFLFLSILFTDMYILKSITV